MPTYTSTVFPVGAFERIAYLFKGRKGLRFLEIGLFEGMGTRYFFEHMLGPDGTFVGIDPFIEYSKCTIAKIGGFDHVMNPSMEGRFLENTAEFSSRITLHKALSQDVLPTLPSASFDLAFIDGDHSRKAVEIDARECWRLVKRGGLIVFDDYTWGLEKGRDFSPKDAIDNFLAQHRHEVIIIQEGWNVILQKNG